MLEELYSSKLIKFIMLASCNSEEELENEVKQMKSKKNYKKEK